MTNPKDDMIIVYDYARIVKEYYNESTMINYETVRLGSERHNNRLA